MFAELHYDFSPNEALAKETTLSVGSKDVISLDS